MSIRGEPMTDMTDDWMNPPPGGRIFEMPKVEDKDEFIIERAKRIVCFGNPGSIAEWNTWGVPYATAAERDEALKKLSADHPMWHLRARTRNRWKERNGFFPPASHPGINR